MLIFIDLVFGCKQIFTVFSHTSADHQSSLCYVMALQLVECVQITTLDLMLECILHEGPSDKC